MEKADYSRESSMRLIAFILLLQLPAAFPFSNLALYGNNIGYARQRIYKVGSPSRRQAFGKSEPSGVSLGKFSVSSSRGSRAPKIQKPPKDDDVPGGAWDSFKAAIYGTVDSVESISEKLQRGEEDLGVQEGYALRAEKDSTSKNANIPPGQRLMNEYRTRSAKTAENIASQESAFDSFKSTVYGTFDSLSSFATDKNGQQDEFQSFRPPVQATSISSEIQEALRDVESKNPVKRKIAELKIKSFEVQEKRRQRAQEREEAARKLKESFYKFGDTVVWSVETISSVPSKVSYAAEETGKAAKNVKKTVDKIPSKVDRAVQTVVSVPDIVKQKANQVQSSFQTSVENTQKTFQEIQAIPSKVQKSIEDTQENIKRTREAIEETTSKVKIMAGLEKPKPKPPKTPPPAPPTAKDIGLKVAGSVVTGTAKATWWVSKGVAGAAWNGVQAAYKNASSKDKATNAPSAKSTKSANAKFQTLEPKPKPESTQESGILSGGTSNEKVKTKTNENKTEEGVTSKSTSMAKPIEGSDKPEASLKSKAGDNVEMKKVEKSLEPGARDVDDEVEEALRQAQSALNFADEETSKRPDTSKPGDEQNKKEEGDDEQ